MSDNRRRVAVAMALATCLTMSSARAQSPPPEAPPAAADVKKAADAKEAEQRFQRSKQLFDEGDYQLALVEISRAYALVPNYRVLFNIAQINIQLFNYAAARTALDKYLTDGGSEIPEARRTQAENDLQMLRGRTAYLKIVTNPRTADVALDDVSLGEGPFTSPILVNAGRRKVVVTRTGYVPVETSVTLAGGDTQDLNIDLVPVPVEERPAGPKLTTITKKNYTPAAIGWAATGVLGVGAVVFGGLYLSKESDLQEMNAATVNVTPSTRDDAQANATRLAVAADVFGVLALGAAVVSVYFTLRPPSTESVQVGKLRVMPTGTGFAGTF